MLDGKEFIAKVRKTKQKNAQSNKLNLHNIFLVLMLNVPFSGKFVSKVCDWIPTTRCVCLPEMANVTKKKTR